jgi:hypothetical protein
MWGPAFGQPPLVRVEYQAKSGDYVFGEKPKHEVTVLLHERIRELWECFEKTRSAKRPLCPDFLLEIAKEIAKGERSIVVPRKREEWPIS